MTESLIYALVNFVFFFVFLSFWKKRNEPGESFGVWEYAIIFTNLISGLLNAIAFFYYLSIHSVMRSFLIAAMLILATVVQAMPVHYDWMADGEVVELFPPLYSIEPGGECPSLIAHINQNGFYRSVVSHLWGRAVSGRCIPSDEDYSFMARPWALYYIVNN
jgi:hypothetical protein